MLPHLKKAVASYSEMYYYMKMPFLTGFLPWKNDIYRYRCDKFKDLRK